MTILSEKNPFYEFSQIDSDTKVEKYKDTITTFYVVQGKLEIGIDNEKVEISSTEGLLVSSNSIIKNIKKNTNTIAFEVISKKKVDRLVELIDKENSIEEKNISGYKILKNHKKVVKPWGYELWIVWLRLPRLKKFYERFNAVLFMKKQQTIINLR